MLEKRHLAASNESKRNQEVATNAIKKTSYHLSNDVGNVCTSEENLFTSVQFCAMQT
jgi:hypothetical protein